MSRVALLVLLLAPLVSEAAPSFTTVDVFVSAGEPLAAWQFELSDETGTMTVVGVENGDSDAFRDAPYYDRAAVEAGVAKRIVVADYSLDLERLPAGRVRVATLHLMLEGTPEFNIRLVNATAADGRRLEATISLEKRQGAGP